MKIGILTLPLHTNYGGILQNYALQEILKKRGHNVTTINHDYKIKNNLFVRYLIYLKRAFRRYILGRDIIVFADKEHNRTEDTKRQYTNIFINKYINCLNIRRIKHLPKKEFDCIVVGSDQIWRRLYNWSFPGALNSFLHFAEDWDIKRVAYAASFGTDEWEYSDEETAICGRLAQKFDAISVRENSAVALCKEKFNVDATHLSDPTMLLTAEDYKKLFKDADTPQSPGNLMCYVLDRNSETEEIIAAIAQEKGLSPFHSNSKVEDPTAPLEERVQPPVEAWLRGFHDAEFVVTDSFHACVFSILFNKPFVVYGNSGRGLARFNSLLSTFGLQNRLCSSVKELDQIINKEIDWDDVNKRLDAMREKSNEFLNIIS